MTEFRNFEPIRGAQAGTYPHQQGEGTERSRSAELEEIREHIRLIEEKLNFLMSKVPGNFASKNQG